MIEVVPVDNRRAARSWADVPATLYAGNPAYVPPLRSDVLTGMDPRKNPFHRHARIQHFVLRQDGRPAGRIAGIVHPAYAERHGRPVGFFGFLDAPLTRAAQEPLLEAAAGWVRRHGMTHLAGPYNYWSGAEFGVLTSAWDRPTASFQTWNPAGLQELLTGLGFAPRSEMAGYEIAVPELGAVREPLLAAAERFGQAGGITTRAFDLGRYRADAEIIRELFAQAFARSAEVLPYPPDVFDSMLDPMKPLLDPELIRFAERDGEPIGFVLTIPNFNDMLARLQGRLGLVGLLRLRSLVRRIDSAVILLLGVRPGQPMGVAHVLFADTLLAVEKGGYQTVHTTWVHEENAVMRGLLGSLVGSTPARSWVVMERPL